MLYHLQRIGPPKSRVESSDVICFVRTITVIGRSPVQVDYVICSRREAQNVIISRRHARVIKAQNGCHTLFDDSRNGIFINNIKIGENQVLNEGDTVTFGHPNGERFEAGKRERQPDSEYQFIFTVCECYHEALPFTPNGSIQSISSFRSSPGQFLVPQPIEFQTPSPVCAASHHHVKDIANNEEYGRKISKQNELCARRSNKETESQSEDGVFVNEHELNESTGLKTSDRGEALDLQKDTDSLSVSILIQNPAENQSIAQNDPITFNESDNVEELHFPPKSGTENACSVNLVEENISSNSIHVTCNDKITKNDDTDNAEMVAYGQTAEVVCNQNEHATDVILMVDQEGIETAHEMSLKEKCENEGTVTPLVNIEHEAVNVPDVETLVASDENSETGYVVPVLNDGSNESSKVVSLIDNERVDISVVNIENELNMCPMANGYSETADAIPALNNQNTETTDVISVVGNTKIVTAEIAPMLSNENGGIGDVVSPMVNENIEMTNMCLVKSDQHRDAVDVCPMVNDDNAIPSDVCSNIASVDVCQIKTKGNHTMEMNETGNSMSVSTVCISAEAAEEDNLMREQSGLEHFNTGPIKVSVDNRVEQELEKNMELDKDVNTECITEISNIEMIQYSVTDTHFVIDQESEENNSCKQKDEIENIEISQLNIVESVVSKTLNKTNNDCIEIHSCDDHSVSVKKTENLNKVGPVPIVNAQHVSCSSNIITLSDSMEVHDDDSSSVQNNQLKCNATEISAVGQCSGEEREDMEVINVEGIDENSVVRTYENNSDKNITADELWTSKDNIGNEISKEQYIESGDGNDVSLEEHQISDSLGVVKFTDQNMLRQNSKNEYAKTSSFGGCDESSDTLADTVRKVDNGMVEDIILIQDTTESITEDDVTSGINMSISRHEQSVECIEENKLNLDSDTLDSIKIITNQDEGETSDDRTVVKDDCECIEGISDHDITLEGDMDSESHRSDQTCIVSSQEEMFSDTTLAGRSDEELEETVATIWISKPNDVQLEAVNDTKTKLISNSQTLDSTETIHEQVVQDTTETITEDVTSGLNTSASRHEQSHNDSGEYIEENILIVYGDALDSTETITYQNEGETSDARTVKMVEVDCECKEQKIISDNDITQEGDLDSESHISDQTCIVSSQEEMFSDTTLAGRSDEELVETVARIGISKPIDDVQLETVNDTTQTDIKDNSNHPSATDQDLTVGEVSNVSSEQSAESQATIGDVNLGELPTEKLKGNEDDASVTDSEVNDNEKENGISETNKKTHKICDDFQLEEQDNSKEEKSNVEPAPMKMCNDLDQLFRSPLLTSSPARVDTTVCHEVPIASANLLFNNEVRTIIKTNKNVIANKSNAVLAESVGFKNSECNYEPVFKKPKETSSFSEQKLSIVGSLFENEMETDQNATEATTVAKNISKAAFEEDKMSWKSPKNITRGSPILMISESNIFNSGKRLTAANTSSINESIDHQFSDAESEHSSSQRSNSQGEETIPTEETSSLFKKVNDTESVQADVVSENVVNNLIRSHNNSKERDDEMEHTTDKSIGDQHDYRVNLSQEKRISGDNCGIIDCDQENPLPLEHEVHSHSKELEVHGEVNTVGRNGQSKKRKRQFSEEESGREERSVKLRKLLHNFCTTENNLKNYKEQAETCQNQNLSKVNEGKDTDQKIDFLLSAVKQFNTKHREYVLSETLRHYLSSLPADNNYEYCGYPITEEVSHICEQLNSLLPPNYTKRESVMNTKSSNSLVENEINKDVGLCESVHTSERHVEQSQTVELSIIPESVILDKNSEAMVKPQTEISALEDDCILNSQAFFSSKSRKPKTQACLVDHDMLSSPLSETQLSRCPLKKFNSSMSSNSEEMDAPFLMSQSQSLSLYLESADEIDVSMLVNPTVQESNMEETKCDGVSEECDMDATLTEADEEFPNTISNDMETKSGNMNNLDSIVIGSPCDTQAAVFGDNSQMVENDENCRFNANKVHIESQDDTTLKVCESEGASSSECKTSQDFVTKSKDAPNANNKIRNMPTEDKERLNACKVDNLATFIKNLPDGSSENNKSSAYYDQDIIMSEKLENDSHQNVFGQPLKKQESNSVVTIEVSKINVCPEPGFEKTAVPGSIPEPSQSQALSIILASDNDVDNHISEEELENNEKGCTTKKYTCYKKQYSTKNYGTESSVVSQIQDTDSGLDGTELSVEPLKQSIIKNVEANEENSVEDNTDAQNSFLEPSQSKPLCLVVESDNEKANQISELVSQEEKCTAKNTSDEKKHSTENSGPKSTVVCDEVFTSEIQYTHSALDGRDLCLEPIKTNIIKNIETKSSDIEANEENLIEEKTDVQDSLSQPSQSQALCFILEYNNEDVGNQISEEEPMSQEEACTAINTSDEKKYSTDLPVEQIKQNIIKNVETKLSDVQANEENSIEEKTDEQGSLPEPTPGTHLILVTDNNDAVNQIHEQEPDSQEESFTARSINSYEKKNRTENAGMESSVVCGDADSVLGVADVSVEQIKENINENIETKSYNIEANEENSVEEKTDEQGSFPEPSQSQALCLILESDNEDVGNQIIEEEPMSQEEGCTTINISDEKKNSPENSGISRSVVCDLVITSQIQDTDSALDSAIPVEQIEQNLIENIETKSSDNDIEANKENLIEEKTDEQGSFPQPSQSQALCLILESGNEDVGNQIIEEEPVNQEEGCTAMNTTDEQKDSTEYSGISRSVVCDLVVTSQIQDTDSAFDGEDVQVEQIKQNIIENMETKSSDTEANEENLIEEKTDEQGSFPQPKPSQALSIIIESDHNDDGNQIIEEEPMSQEEGCTKINISDEKKDTDSYLDGADVPVEQIKQNINENIETKSSDFEANKENSVEEKTNQQSSFPEPSQSQALSVIFESDHNDVGNQVVEEEPMSQEEGCTAINISDEKKDTDSDLDGADVPVEQIKPNINEHIETQSSDIEANEKNSIGEKNVKQGSFPQPSQSQALCLILESDEDVVVGSQILEEEPMSQKEGCTAINISDENSPENLGTKRSVGSDLVITSQIQVTDSVLDSADVPVEQIEQNIIEDIETKSSDIEANEENTVEEKTDEQSSFPQPSQSLSVILESDHNDVGNKNFEEEPMSQEEGCTAINISDEKKDTDYDLDGADVALEQIKQNIENIETKSSDIEANEENSVEEKTYEQCSLPEPSQSQGLSLILESDNNDVGNQIHEEEQASQEDRYTARSTNSYEKKDSTENSAMESGDVCGDTDTDLPVEAMKQNIIENIEAKGENSINAVVKCPNLISGDAGNVADSHELCPVEASRNQLPEEILVVHNDCEIVNEISSKSVVAWKSEINSKDCEDSIAVGKIDAVVQKAENLKNGGTESIIRTVSEEIIGEHNLTIINTDTTKNGDDSMEVININQINCEGIENDGSSVEDKNKPIVDICSTACSSMDEKGSNQDENVNKKLLDGEIDEDIEGIIDEISKVRPVEVETNQEIDDNPRIGGNKIDKVPKRFPICGEDEQKKLEIEHLDVFKAVPEFKQTQETSQSITQNIDHNNDICSEDEFCQVIQEPDDQFIASSSQDEEAHVMSNLQSERNCDLLGLNKLIQSQSPKKIFRSASPEYGNENEEIDAVCMDSQVQDSQQNEQIVSTEEVETGPDSPEIPVCPPGGMQQRTKNDATNEITQVADDEDLMSQEIPVYTNSAKHSAVKSNKKIEKLSEGNRSNIISCEFDNDSEMEFQAPEINFDSISSQQVDLENDYILEGRNNKKLLYDDKINLGSVENVNSSDTEDTLVNEDSEGTNSPVFDRKYKKNDDNSWGTLNLKRKSFELKSRSDSDIKKNISSDTEKNNISETRLKVKVSEGVVTDNVGPEIENCDIEVETESEKKSQECVEVLEQVLPTKCVKLSEENMADNDRNLKDSRGKDENVEFKYVLSEDENNTVEEDTDQNEIIDLFSATQEVLIPNVEIRKSAALSTASNIKVDATDKIKSCPLRNRSFPSESATSSRKKGKFCEDSVVSTEQENLCDDLTESQEIPLINLFASKTRKRKNRNYDYDDESEVSGVETLPGSTDEEDEFTPRKKQIRTTPSSVKKSRSGSKKRKTSCSSEKSTPRCSKRKKYHLPDLDAATDDNSCEEETNTCDDGNHSDQDVFSSSQPQISSPCMVDVYTQDSCTDFTQTQMSPSIQQSQVTAVLERIRRKRRERISTEIKSPVSEKSMQSSQESVDDAISSTATRALPANDCFMSTADNHITRACSVLDDMGRLLTATSNKDFNVAANPRVQAWQNDLKKLKQKKDLPKTIIAVVGATGAGKSSLMNALLDHSDILPTSGMRACTAVVVEIAANMTDGCYRAEIDFLSENEWNDELELLLRELRGPDGVVRARMPDPQSEAGVAWSKIRAVYGQFKDAVTLNDLARNKAVTKYLGTTKRICKTSPELFTQGVNHFIASRDSGSGGDFWPVVKHVKLHIPNCGVCNTGAVLVDLPGIRDSNAARDRIAKDFLKNCTAVWVVANINRAVDDKTAKDLLGENFRRQLLMDGQYGSVSFICTKTDQIITSETVRDLDISHKVGHLEVTKKEIAENSLQVRSQLKVVEKQLTRIQNNIQKAEKETDELLQDVQELQHLLEILDEGEEKEQTVNELTVSEKAHADKKLELEQCRQNMKDCKLEKRNKENKNLELEKKMLVTQKQISALCSLERNDHIRKQIKRDFRAGIKEMKRQAGVADENEDEPEDDYNSESETDDESFNLTVENLKVFCVSSVEYLKLKGKFPTDGPTQTFSKCEDTGIPALQTFVHELTRVRKLQGTKRLLSCVGQYVSDLYSYLIDEGTEDHSTRGDVYNVFERHLRSLRIGDMRMILDVASEDIENLFNKNLKEKSEEGASAATAKAYQTCIKWGSKQNKDKPKEGGLHFSTYKATINRHGAYKSKSGGDVDFNEDLAAPMYASLMIMWDWVFNKKLLQIFEICKSQILSTMKRFADNMRRDVSLMEVTVERIDRVYGQHMNSANTKLDDTVNNLKEFTIERQRDINRILTPAVQQSMMEVYSQCAAETGTGQFARMKSHLAAGVNSQRGEMFDEASRQLLEQLLVLHAEVTERLNNVIESLLGDLKTLYETLWESPFNTQHLRTMLLPGINPCRERMMMLMEEANIEIAPNNDDGQSAQNVTETPDVPTANIEPDSILTYERISNNNSEIRPNAKKESPNYGSNASNVKVERLSGSTKKVFNFIRTKSSVVKKEVPAAFGSQHALNMANTCIVKPNTVSSADNNIAKPISVVRCSAKPHPACIVSDPYHSSSDTELPIFSCHERKKNTTPSKLSLSRKNTKGKSSSQPERQLIREDVESNKPLPRIQVLQPKKPPVLQDKTNSLRGSSGNQRVIIKTEPGLAPRTNKRKKNSGELIDLTVSSGDEELPPFKKFLG